MCFFRVHPSLFTIPLYEYGLYTVKIHISKYSQFLH